MVIVPHTSHNNAANYLSSQPAMHRCFLCFLVSRASKRWIVLLRLQPARLLLIFQSDFSLLTSPFSLFSLAQNLGRFYPRN